MVINPNGITTAKKGRVGLKRKMEVIIMPANPSTLEYLAYFLFLKSVGPSALLEHLTIDLIRVVLIKGDIAFSEMEGFELA